MTRLLTTEEAVRRIAEGDHAEFAQFDSKVVNDVLIEALQNGEIIAAINDENVLMFSRPERTT